MMINDITIQKIQPKHINQLFDMSKKALEEKGIDNIRDDILMAGLKNIQVKKYSNIDFGMFKLNTLIGFGFVEFSQMVYEQKPIATVSTIYVLPEFRSRENYLKLINEILLTLTKIGIDTVKTTDDWTLCNDCEIFKSSIQSMSRKETVYRMEIE